MTCVVPNCPHHFHNHPVIRVRGHDLERERVSRALIMVSAQMLATASQHPGELNDVLDVMPEIGRMLDGLRWESPGMLTYLHSQSTSQEEAMKRQADLVRCGDIQGLIDYGLELERQNPLPLISRE